MKKLLFVINVDWYFNLHWKERLLSEMTKGYNVHLCLAKTDGDFYCEDCEHKFVSINRSSIGLINNLKSLFALWRVVRDVKPELIHSVTVKPNIFCGLLAWIFSIPIILTIPGMGTVFSSSGGKYALLRRLIVFLYRCAGRNKRSFFVFENASDMQNFINYDICSRQRCTLVSGAGVDLNYFRQLPEQVSSGGVLRVLFAGRLLWGKGLDDLIKAVRILRKKGMAVRLDVAGIIDSASRESIPVAQMEEWAASQDINWLGQIDDMATLLSEVHVVALPTRYAEGLPRILIEAAACGKPVISTDVPGCRDFVENGVTGILVDCGSVEQLAAAIESLADAKARAAMGQAGRDKVEKGYSSRNVIEHYAKIYGDLIPDALVKSRASLSDG